jgi:manganese efflux pump family protein
MNVIGLITGVVAAGLGLYLLSIWLIEYDGEFQSAAATRLPPSLLAGHVLAAVTALLLWVAYLAWDSDRLAWYSVLGFVVAAGLGLTMAFRWISVYRAKRAGLRVAARFLAAPTADGAPRSYVTDIGPPERNFPLAVVLAHGVFAVTTLTVVLLCTVGVFDLSAPERPAAGGDAFGCPQPGSSRHPDALNRLTAGHV